MTSKPTGTMRSTTGDAEAELTAPGDYWTARPEWAGYVQAAAAQISTAGLGGLPGIDGGKAWLTRQVRAGDGMVIWTIWWRLRGKQSTGPATLVGRFVTDCIPPDHRVTGQRQPVQTHGRAVLVAVGATVGRRRENIREVRVVVDAHGLPVPVPVEVWNAQFA